MRIKQPTKSFETYSGNRFIISGLKVCKIKIVISELIAPMSNKYARGSLTLLSDRKTLLRQKPKGAQTVGMQLKQGIYPT
jgi:hypothetical protein